MLLILVIPVSRKRKEKFYRHLLSDCILMLRLLSFALVHFYYISDCTFFFFLYYYLHCQHLCFRKPHNKPLIFTTEAKKQNKKTEYFPSVSESRCRICSAASLAHFTLHPQSRTVNIVEINPTERITTKKYRKVGNKYGYFYSIYYIYI